MFRRIWRIARILDACVGSEKIYFGMNKKLGDDFISIDIRKGDFSFQGINVAPIKVIIKPTVLADMKQMPFKNEVFYVVIIDPPHLNLGKSGTTFMSKAYGSWEESEEIKTLYLVNVEFNRVLKDHGMLIIKILPEKKDRYFSLLSNFIFYLPIHVIKQKGCFNTKEAKLAACWYVGIKKELEKLKNEESEA